MTRKNVHDMTKGKTLTTWVQEWVVGDSTLSAEEGSSIHSTLKEDFQVGDLADFIFDLDAVLCQETPRIVSARNAQFKVQ